MVKENGIENRLGSISCERVVVPGLGSGVYAKASWGLEYWMLDAEEVILGGARVKKGDLTAMPVVFLRKERAVGGGCPHVEIYGPVSAGYERLSVDGLDNFLVAVGVPLAPMSTMKRLECDGLMEEVVRNQLVITGSLSQNENEVDWNIDSHLSGRHKIEGKVRAIHRGGLYGLLGLCSLAGYVVNDGSLIDRLFFTTLLAVPFVEGSGWLATKYGSSAVDIFENKTMSLVKKLRAIKKAEQGAEIKEKFENSFKSEMYFTGAVGIVKYGGAANSLEDGIVAARMYLGLDSPKAFPLSKVSEE